MKVPYSISKINGAVDINQCFMVTSDTLEKTAFFFTGHNPSGKETKFLDGSISKKDKYISRLRSQLNSELQQKKESFISLGLTHLLGVSLRRTRTDEYPGSKFVLSCRSLEFPNDKKQYFDSIEFLPVSDEQIKSQFIEHLDDLVKSISNSYIMCL